MKLPVKTDSLTFTLIGDVLPVLDYETKQPKYDTNGQALYRVPVLVGGTGARFDAQVSVTVAGTVPALSRGRVTFTNLTVTSWSLRGADGRERSGVSFRADAVEQAK